MGVGLGDPAQWDFGFFGEETDALVLVVSEETGIISMASGGLLTREVSATRVRELLTRRPARTSTELRQIETA